VYYCLWNNRERLSEDCRNVMNKYPPQSASRRYLGRHRGKAARRRD